MDWPAKPYIAPNTLHVCDWLDLMQALPDGSADMILTDMPYGTTACAWDTVIDLAAWWVEVRRVMKPRGAVVCTASQPFTSRLVSSNYEWFRYEWVWVKSRHSNFANLDYMPRKCHESILVFGGSKYYPQMIARNKPYKKRQHRERLSDNVVNLSYSPVDSLPFITHSYPESVLYFANGRQQESKHPTQKPVALFEYLIKTYTQPGELVVDPFVGSGTTAVAAKITGRRFICGDQSPEYIDIASKRVFPTFGQPPRRKRETKPITELPLFAGLEQEKVS